MLGLELAALLVLLIVVLFVTMHAWHRQIESETERRLIDLAKWRNRQKEQ